jgi:hypothetical protein
VDRARHTKRTQGREQDSRPTDNGEEKITRQVENRRKKIDVYEKKTKMVVKRELLEWVDNKKSHE